METQPTLGDRIIAALAQAGYNILEADKAKIVDALKGANDQFASFLTNTVEKNFPRKTMEERMAAGPIEQLLNNSTTDISVELGIGETALIATIETALKNASSV